MAKKIEYDLNQNLFFINDLWKRALPFTINVNYTIKLPPEQIPQTSNSQFEPVKNGWEILTSEIKLRLIWKIVGDGVLITLKLRNNSGKNIILHNISPATFDLADIRDDLAEYKFYQHGYQSWSPCRPLPADTTQQYPRMKSFALMNQNVDSPFWKRDDGSVSHLFSVLNHPEKQALLFGFTRQETGLGEVFLRNRGLAQMITFLDYGGKQLEPDEELVTEPLLVSVGDPDRQVDQYMTILNHNMVGQLPEKSPVGWCSWYEFYTRISEEKILNNTSRLAQSPSLGVEFVQLDDGYQTAVGDWLNLNKKFPSGLKKLAGKIKTHGFKAGIWLAPFMVARNSELFKTQPDWFQKDSKGKALDCGYNPSWNSRTVALDLSNPKVEQWLRYIFEKLVEAGFDYFKIDFIFAGLRNGRRFRQDLSPVEIYRNGLRIIRDTIGPDRFLLGCGAPIGPSIGLVDAMRVSEDVKETWHNRLWEWLGRGVGVPSAKGSLRNNVQRHFTHRKLWLNDPDCLLVRDRNTSLTLEETETMVTLLGMTGGMLFLSDDMTRISRRRIQLLKKVLPPTPLTGYPVGQFTNEYPDIFKISSADRQVVAFTNWDDRTSSFDPAEAFSGEGNYIFDFWKQKPADMSDFKLTAHHSRAFQVSPFKKYPTVIGTDLHIAALCDGRIMEDFSSATGILTVVVDGLSQTSGQIWIGVPEPYTYLGATGDGDNLNIESWDGGIKIVLKHQYPLTVEIKFLDS